MRRSALFLSALIIGLMPVFAHAEDPSANFTDAQRAEIKAIIKDYLTKENPEVLVQAGQELQHREQTTAEAKSTEAVSKDKDKIFNDPNTPVGGNPKGDVTVVEFFDYQCGYCKMTEEAVEKLLAEDKKVKLVFKNFPILGAMSKEAAKASFASIRQDKFLKFHEALMNKKDHITQDLLAQTAKDVGMDVDKMKKDMADPAIDKLVQDSIALGGEVGARGTPFFIVGEHVFSGALQYDELKKAVDATRNEKKS
jgi:protein-disulfide isomerase